MKDANFTSAILKGVDFSNANMRGTILDGADIEGANFSDAKGLTEEQFRKAKNWQLARNIPSYLKNIRTELEEKHAGRLSLHESEGGALSLAGSSGELSLAGEEAAKENPKPKKKRGWRLFGDK